MDRQTAIVLVGASFAFFACRTGSGILPRKGPTAGLSKTSSITIAGPNRDQLKPEQQEKLNGFRLSVEPVDAACVDATKFNTAGSLSQPTLNASIVQGCDYLLILEFGHLPTGATSLEKVYFANVTATSQGLALKKEDIAGKPDVNVSIILRITDLGIADGFGKTDGTIIAPPASGDTGSVVINATIDGSPGSVQPPVPPNGNGTSTTINFADIRDSARTSCGGGSCHAPADTENWWKSNATAIKDRLTSTDAGRMMPKFGSSQLTRFTAESKKKMLDFLK